MKGILVLWIGLALIAADLLVTKQGQNLWALFTQPAQPKTVTTKSTGSNTFLDPTSPGAQSVIAQAPYSKQSGAILAMSGYGT